MSRKKRCGKLVSIDTHYRDVIRLYEEDGLPPEVATWHMEISDFEHFYGENPTMTFPEAFQAMIGCGSEIASAQSDIARMMRCGMLVQRPDDKLQSVVNPGDGWETDWIYIVRYCESGDWYDGFGHIKIGMTKRPIDRRVEELTQRTPYGMEVLALIRGGINEETSLHRYFKSIGAHVTGEWFRSCPEIWGLIDKANHESCEFASKSFVREELRRLGFLKPDLDRRKGFR